MSTIIAPADTIEKLLTAEEFAELPELNYPCELDEGRLSFMNVPSFQHGKVCATIATLLGLFVRENNLGHVLSNDSGVITKRGPDSVRGADVSFYSFDAVARDNLPKPYPKSPPDLVFEVLSPSERPARTAIKLGEYLAMGVKVVCVVNTETETLEVHRKDQPVTTLTTSDNLQLPDVLPGLSIPLDKFFE